MTDQARWRLVLEVDAATEKEAVWKFMDKVMFMLVNDVEEDGSATLRIEAVRP